MNQPLPIPSAAERGNNVGVRPEAPLIHEIQRLFERTYDSVGVDLAECLIGRERCAHLSRQAGGLAADFSPRARTFLRRKGGRLFVGIWFCRSLIADLEREDPRRGLSDRNMPPLIAFIEEINHAVHAALRFQSGQREIERESFAIDLELQALVDIYLTLLLFAGLLSRRRKVDEGTRQWIRGHLFDGFDPGSFSDPRLRRRYSEAAALGKRYTAFLDRLDPASRIPEIRNFQRLSYEEKKSRILLSPAAPGAGLN